MKQFVKCAGLAVIACAIGVAAASPVQAQTSNEFSGGYQYTHVQGGSLPRGWYADYAVPVRGVWAVFGEVNGAYKNGSKQHVYGGGIRYMARMTPTVRPFAQVLVGAATFGFCCGFGSVTDFAMQFGGGVNIPVGPKWGVRVGADYRPVFSEFETDNQFRFVIGAAFPGR
jgi:hypothetical protein